MKNPIQVRSSFILQVQYNENNQTLDVWFKGKQVKKYRYSNVTKQKFSKFMNAESKSSYFATHIKPNHKFKLVKVITL
jgi:hypothetical protein